MSLSRIQKLSVLLGLALTIVCAFAFDISAALSLFAGASVSIAGFLVLKIVFRELFNNSDERSNLKIGGLLVLKTITIGLILWLLIKYVHVNSWALLTGLSVVVLAITMETMYICIKGKRWHRNHS